MNTQVKIPHELQAFPDWHKMPFKLNKYEMIFPANVIKDYFKHFDLTEVRDHFKDLLSDALEADEPDGANHLFFQQETEKLLEAVYWMKVQGQLGLAEEREKKIQSFISDYLEEMMELFLDFAELIVKVRESSESEQSTLTPQTGQLLTKLELVACQMRTDQRDMEAMVSANKKQPDNPQRELKTVETVPFIQERTEFFHAFNIYEKGFELNIDEQIQPTITVDPLILEMLLDTLLFTAYSFCPAQSSVKLDCQSSVGSLNFTISFEKEILEGVKDHFPRYELFAGSAVAGAHLHESGKDASDLQGTLLCWSSEGKTYFKVIVPTHG